MDKDNKNTAFIDYIREDKSRYTKASKAGYYDPDGDFLIGDSGGFLLNIDFIVWDTWKFSEMANIYNRDKAYTKAPIDSPAHDSLRVRETDRRKNGFTQNCKLPYSKMSEFFSLPEGKREHLLEPLRITGEHYNFLNYSQMLRVEKEKGTGKTADKKRGFPRFFTSQYWLAKVREFAKNNGFNLVIGKSRRAGFSYYMGCAAANQVNLIPDITVLLAAYDTKYLTRGNAIAPMARRQIIWYETKTNGLFMRGFLKKDLTDMQLGYKEPDGSVSEDGWNSYLPSVSFGPANPDAAIGKDAVEIDVEELNNAPNLDGFMNVTDPATKAGTYKTGIIVGFGTGGSTEGDWQNFEAWFYNPSSWTGMPFENVWDYNSRGETCGYFKPYWEALEGKHPETGEYAMDAHGNSNYEVAMSISEFERREAEKEKSPSDYIVHCGQYANFPSESFSAGIENMFSSPELNDHIQRVKSDPNLKFHVDGMVVNEDGHLKFRTNSYLEARGNKVHPYIDKFPIPRDEKTDYHGCIRIWYMPFLVNGVVPKDLYKISYDPVGVSKAKGEVTDKHSLCSVTVRMLPNNYTPYNVPEGGLDVARWVGRTESLEDDDAIVLKLCEFYNAKVLAEGNRGQIYKDFKDWKKLKFLDSDPTSYLDGKFVEGQSVKYNINIVGEMKLNGYKYVKDRVYSRIGVNEEGKDLYWFHTCNDLGLLYELQKFNPTKNHDRISEFIVREYDNRGQITKKINSMTSNTRNKKFIRQMVSGTRYN